MKRCLLCLLSLLVLMANESFAKVQDNTRKDLICIEGQDNTKRELIATRTNDVPKHVVTIVASGNGRISPRIGNTTLNYEIREETYQMEVLEGDSVSIFVSADDDFRIAHVWYNDSLDIRLGEGHGMTWNGYGDMYYHNVFDAFYWEGCVMKDTKFYIQFEHMPVIHKLLMEVSDYGSVKINNRDRTYVLTNGQCEYNIDEYDNLVVTLLPDENCHLVSLTQAESNNSDCPTDVTSQVVHYSDGTLRYIMESMSKDYSMTATFAQGAPDELVGNDGDVFTATNVDGLELKYMIISESEKTCQVGSKPEVGYSSSSDTANAVDGEIEGTVNIPEIANGYRVVKIGYQAFFHCSKVTTINIPNSVMDIGYLALSGTGITSLTIPSSVTRLSWGALQECDNLMSINVESGNSVYDSRDNCNAVIESGSNTLVRGCRASTVPNGVTAIGLHAFDLIDGDGFSITLPNTVTTIGTQAFNSCSLTNITLPNSLTSVGYACFAGSQIEEIQIPASMTEIYAGGFRVGTLKKVISEVEIPFEAPDDAFDNYETAILYVPESSLEAYRSTNPWSRFLNIRTIDSLDDPEQNPNDIIDFADAEVKRICVENWDTNGDGELSYGEAAAVTDIDEVFKSNKKIVSFNELQYFTGLDTLHSLAFISCTNLEQIVLPSSLTTLGSSCLQGCSKLIEIKLPLNLETIGSQAFDGCNTISSLYIPSKVSKIEYNTINGCNNLETIEIAADNLYYESPQNCNAIIEKSTKTLISGCKTTKIPDDVLRIGFDAFSGITNLENLLLPNGLIYIGAYAFNGCKMLSKITIPNSVNTIMWFAFLDCENLTSLFIPASVSYIGEGVTATYSNKLKSLQVSEDNPIYDSRDNCNAIIATSSNKLIAGCETSIIPQTVTSIGNRAFLGRYGFKSIEIPGNIKTVEEYAYASCKNVETIILHKGIVSIADYVFYSINSLKEVYSYSNEPFSIQKSSFGGKESNVTLYVPYGCKAAYEVADYWKEFKEIIEMDGDNSLYADDVTIRPGVQKTITLQLDNENTFIAGEFRLQLPEGIRMETDEDGDPIANLVSERINKHTLMVTDEGNGLYHFMFYSGQNRAILGNSGDFITLSVIADEELEEGSYIAELKNVIFSTEDEKQINLPDITFNINVLDYTPADVNGDGSLNVMDVVKLVNYIMGRNPSDFVFSASDMDENGKINVMDLVNVVEVIMAAPQYVPINHSSISKLSSLKLDRTAKNTISLNVPDADKHIAAQFIVTLSGKSVLKDALSDAAHKSEITRMADGRYKVMVYSGKNDVFRNDSPISLQLSDDSDVIIEDVVFVDTTEEPTTYESVKTNTTGIMSTVSKFSQPTDIYTVSGKLVKKKAISTIGLAKGIYVVNNEKVIIK